MTIRLPISSRATPALSTRIAARATERPWAPAIVAGGRTMTYGDLDRRANRLANRLTKAGVAAETVVAVCLDRSPESVLSALAVFKTGGAYLPLDPRQPIDRLLLMLCDAQPLAVITTRDLAESLLGNSWDVIAIDDCATEEFSGVAPSVEIFNDQLAYVIYTSGSAGQPKGVEVTHASLTNLIDWHTREFCVTENDRASHLASVGFDAAVWEVWPTLATGATLYLCDDDTRLSPTALRDWLVTNRITTSFVPTPLAEILMTLEWPQETALRLLLTGADTLHRYPPENLPFAVVNNYGPTECAVVATSGRVDPGRLKNQLPTIGYPISNTSAYVLDNELKEVAPGEAGELYIGGVCVARGYRNRPELTADKFIRNPFGSDPSARLYRTGDLARRSHTGEVAYLGRMDEQINLHGYRIEPAEIEAGLNRHPAVTSSAVIANDTNNGEKRLAAYISTRDNVTLTVAELREFLKDSLPDHMLPSLFMKMNELPVTANGKTDRAALPEPTAANIMRDEEFIAPRSPIEQRLARMVGSLLNVDEVSVTDDFFLIGGHSLLGTQLIVKIRGAFGVHLTLRALFAAPTIAELSGQIENLMIARVKDMRADEARLLPA